MKASSACLAAIRKIEGFKAKAYNDPPGSSTWSIGYGHQITAGDVGLQSQTITTVKADTLLLADVASREAAINQALQISKTTVSQNTFDAWVRFGYNEGVGTLNLILATYRSNTLNMKAVTDRMLLYDKVHDAGGNLVVSPTLASLRKQEVELINSFLPSVPPDVQTAALTALAVLAGYFGYTLLRETSS